MRQELRPTEIPGTSPGRFAVGWFHSTGNLFESEGATGANEDCNEYVTDEVTAPTGPTGNPFVYLSARHQFLAYYGIAGRIVSNCDDITDLNDWQMCRACRRARRARAPR